MHQPARNFDISARIRALKESGLLELTNRDQFSQLTDHVRALCNAPVAIVSLVDEHRQVFAGHSGLPAPWDTLGETPMSHSFCQYVVNTGAPLMLTDARLDPILKDNLAIYDIGVISYLGVPLKLPGGEIVGALAAIDGKPRIWTPTDLKRLRAIAGQVETEMGARISTMMPCQDVVLEVV